MQSRSKLDDFHPYTSTTYMNIGARYDRIIGSLGQRSDIYKSFFSSILKECGCVNVLDVSCGTGVDSVILLEQGFKLVSVDASAQMLEFAEKKKADTTGDPRYDEWIIHQAYWQSLSEDLSTILTHNAQFDAVVCLANSFPHLLEDDDGGRTVQKQCLKNIARCVKPGGVLLIDHRNYDAILDNIPTPDKNVYYNYKNPLKIKTTVVVEDTRPKMGTFDFCIDDTSNLDDRFQDENILCDILKFLSSVRLSFYPHRLASFTRMLDEVFGGTATHTVYGDFSPLGVVPVPGFYLHVMHKIK